MAESTTRDWDASTYQRVALPHEEWARAVLDRLGLEGGETVLDAGCGSGRTTAIVIERLPDGPRDRGRRLALDGREGAARCCARRTRRSSPTSPSWSWTSRSTRSSRPPSSTGSPTTTRSSPGCGRRSRRAAASPPSAAARATSTPSARPARRSPRASPTRRTWPGSRSSGTTPAPEETEERLRAAGFTDVRCWLEPWPVVPPEPRDVRADGLPRRPRRRAARGAARPVRRRRPRHPGASPLRLDYVRLNIEATAA